MDTYDRELYVTLNQPADAEFYVAQLSSTMHKVSRLQKVALDTALKYTPSIHLMIHRLYLSESLADVFSEIEQMADISIKDIQLQTLSGLTVPTVGEILFELGYDSSQWADMLDQCGDLSDEIAKYYSGQTPSNLVAMLDKVEYGKLNWSIVLGDFEGRVAAGGDHAIRDYAVETNPDYRDALGKAFKEISDNDNDDALADAFVEAVSTHGASKADILALLQTCYDEVDAL